MAHQFYIQSAEREAAQLLLQSEEHFGAVGQEVSPDSLSPASRYSSGISAGEVFLSAANLSAANFFDDDDDEGERQL